jgi:hypothetical protein
MQDQTYAEKKRKDTSMSCARFESATPVFQRKGTIYVLALMATGIGHQVILYVYIPNSAIKV